MKLLHISHHIGCMRDHAYIYHKLGFEYEFWKFHKGLYKITKDVADKTWNERKDYFNSFDYIVTSDTAPLSRIFMENITELKPKIVVWICNRFDYNMEFDESFYKIFNKISIENQDKFKLVPYSDFESIWCKLRRIPFVLQPITPIGKNIMELEYKIDGVKELQTMYVEDGNAKHKYNDITELENKMIIPIYGNENLFLNLKEIFESNGIECFNGGYKHSYDLKNSKGLIVFPDQFSKLVTFETIQNEIIVFLPSEDFLIKLHPARTKIPYGFNCPLGYLNKELVQLCEWYRYKECRIYFDSLDDMIYKIQSLTPDIINEKKEWCRKYGKQIEEENLNKWKNVFNC